MPTTSEIASEIGALADVEGRVARPSAAIPPVGPKAAVALVRLVAPLLREHSLTFQLNYTRR